MTGPCNGMLKLAISSQRWGWISISRSRVPRQAPVAAAARPSTDIQRILAGVEVAPAKCPPHAQGGGACARGPQKYPDPEKSSRPLARLIALFQRQSRAQRIKINSIDSIDRPINQLSRHHRSRIHEHRPTRQEAAPAGRRIYIDRGRSGWLPSPCVHAGTYIHTSYARTQPTNPKPKPKPPPHHTQIDPHDTTTITLRPPPAPTQ